jgi:signal transduction histidine kinase/ActR/RegA family two-component response regulator
VLLPEIPDAMLEAAAVEAEHLRLMRQLELRSAVVVPITTGARVLGALTLVFAESGRRYDERDLAFVEEVGRRAGIAIENARLYAAEQRTRQAADVANRTKDEFLATVSHEPRTPLTAILGWSKLLVSDGMDDDKRKRATETIERNAVSMAQLIEDLLDVSRIVSGKMRIEVKPVDLVAVIEAALESTQPAALAKDIQVTRDLKPDTGKVLGDPARLQQVVWNLVNNAVKFTPRGGKVSVALVKEPDACAIVVTDSGKGIEPRFLPFVFEPFRQGEGGIARSSGGLGLGLGISKHLVELHGGTIEAASEGAGKGATFTVHIPTAASARAGAAEARPRAPTPGRTPVVEPLPQLKGLDVLVVDDEPDARALVRAVLEQCGSVVRTAGSVDEALAAIEARVPDVLVSDIGMPHQSGYDLMRKIRALPHDRGGAIPAAALTAYARAEDRSKALGAGFMMHVPKPVEPAELVTVVAELARSRQPASSRP